MRLGRRGAGVLLSIHQCTHVPVPCTPVHLPPCTLATRHPCARDPCTCVPLPHDAGVQAQEEKHAGVRRKYMRTKGTNGHACQLTRTCVCKRYHRRRRRVGGLGNRHRSWGSRLHAGCVKAYVHARIQACVDMHTHKYAGMDSALQRSEARRASVEHASIRDAELSEV